MDTASDPDTDIATLARQRNVVANLGSGHSSTRNEHAEARYGDAAAFETGASGDPGLYLVDALSVGTGRRRDRVRAPSTEPKHDGSTGHWRRERCDQRELISTGRAYRNHFSRVPAEDL